MPVYDYRCRACGAEFSVTASVTDERTGVACPGGHADVGRVFRPVALTGTVGEATGCGCGGGGCGCR